MKAPHLFVISSAINHFCANKLSRFSTQERFNQTMETINNIKEKVPGAKICLFEVSETRLDEIYIDEIKNSVDLFVELYNDNKIIELYNNFVKFKDLFKYGKSLFELYGMIYALNLIDDKFGANNIDRVFKISGRYLLNSDFDINQYNSVFLKNKYIAKCVKYSNYEPNSNAHFHIYQNKGHLITGLWSFDSSLLYKTIDTLEKAFNYLQILLMYGDGNDIEHSIYHFVDKNDLIDCNVLGLYVRKGMDDDDYNI